MKRINNFKEMIPEIKQMLISGMSIGKIAKVMNLQSSGLLYQMKTYSNEFGNIKFRTKVKDSNKNNNIKMKSK